ncbi:pectin lyase fold/virulence factor [Immersiella caudata]|uniref:Pectin lyase fold/virulence factor n=1 Tax=Immersiella caudata TaxID=314043 RepID=A0AA39WZ51_9PEZI|nr:pectin lyase fold/virulence factor [Immersiella caudata]
MLLNAVFIVSAVVQPLAWGAPFEGLASWDVEGFARDNPLGPTTGGAGGTTVTVENAADLKKAVTGDVPKIVLVKGNITLPSRIKIGSNKSVLGVGTTAYITSSGLDLQNVSNVIIRNLKIGYIVDNDCITIRNTTRVWVDHNEFTSDISQGPDAFDGQVDIIRASDYITISWNFFHNHWKSSLVGNDAEFRDLDSGHLHITYHHNYWHTIGTRGPAGRFGHQHVYNNLYVDYLYQALHSRSDNQMLVEGNVFRGTTREALSTYGLVIPEDSPNTCVCGDEELDGWANLGAENDWGKATINITQVGNFTKAPYKFVLTPLNLVEETVKAGAGVGKI